ncbi:MAG TPA: type II toxin-antitoxin system VapC family toxin [Reyranella sp.]|nr:type II toxin-antitoxin system VapC family toxin [Reyranella sp.]
MLCLDTNVIIAIMTGRSATAIRRFREEVTRGRRILIPAIVVHELRFGVAKSTRRASNEQAVDSFLAPYETPSFDLADAADAADIRVHLHRRGTPIGPYDLLIAAQARRRGAILVTSNVREFRRVPGLAVENWARP